MCRFFKKNYYFSTSYITVIIQTVRFPKTCQCRAGCSSVAEHHSSARPRVPAAALQEQAGARSEVSSYVSITKRTQAGERSAAAKLSSLPGSTHSCSLQTSLLRLSFGEFRRRNVIFPLGTQLRAHPLSHQSLHREMCSPPQLHYKPRSFTCNCTWLYIFNFFLKV